QIREILISESAWEEMTCLFAPSLNRKKRLYSANYFSLRIRDDKITGKSKYRQQNNKNSQFIDILFSM
ncbi:hypothetical protein ACJEQJ_24250, partial [Klebsiella pneumoniae]